MNALKPIDQAIADIRYTGEHPLLQYDLLDGRTLLRTLLADYPQLNSHRLGKILKSTDLRCVGLQSICSLQCYLWTCLPPQPIEQIVRLARQRLLTDARELHTELLIHSGQPVPPAEPWSLLNFQEKRILELRLEGHPPRRAAAIMQLFPHVVYRVSQQLQKKLKVTSLTDTHALRRRAQEEGVIPLDDRPIPPVIPLTQDDF